MANPWERYFDTQEAFVETLSPYVPEAVFLGRVVVSRESLLISAWNDPALGMTLIQPAFRLAQAAGLVPDPDPATRAQTGASVTDQAEGLGIVYPDGWTIQGTGGGMAPLVIPNVYRVAIEAAANGQPVVNVLHFRGSTSGQGAALATAIGPLWGTATGLCALLPTSYAVTQYRIMDLSSVDGQIIINPSTAAGQKTGPLSTNAACALVNLNGGSRNPRGRGRMYFGPVIEADTNADGRTINSTYRNALVAELEQFRAGMDSAGFSWCVASRVGASATDITNVSVQTVLATQRRRLRD